MKNLIRASIATVAFAAVCVVPSVASASPELTHPTGTTAPVGTLIEGINVAHAATPTPVTFTTPLGNIQCTTLTFTGKLIKNTGTQIEIEITTFEIRGTAGVVPHTTHCSSITGSGTMTVTPNHTTNPVHNGISSLPWCLKAEGLKNEFTISGGACGAPRALTLTFDTSVAGACSYQKASIAGTYTTHPVDAIFTAANFEFTKTTGSAFCPGSWKMDFAFTLTTDENTTPLYIS